MSDFYKMSAMMKDLFPSNPEADKQALKAMAGNPQESVASTKDYVQESVEVPQGSMPLGIDNVSDFAKLAGITETQKTGSAGQAKGKDPMPAKTKPTAGPEQKHPLRNKLVGEEDDPFIKAVDNSFGQSSIAKKIGFSPTGELYKAIYRAIKAVMPDASEEEIKKAATAASTSMQESMQERSLTKGEEKKKEKYVKGMKKAKGDFQDRYGKDAKAVMYATATKMAKKEAIETSLRDRLYKALNSQK